MLPKSLENLIAEFGKLPGVGPRSAERLAFYSLRAGTAEAAQLASALSNLHSSIRECRVCFNLSEETECTICRNPSRNRKIIAIVEEPLDVIAIEKTGSYRGLYHVLGGVISPVDGIGPDQLTIKPLLRRIQQDNPEELILATNPSVEGEATALFIQKQVDDSLRITRLARGLPVGSDLEYADQITLGRALEGRQLL